MHIKTLKWSEVKWSELHLLLFVHPLKISAPRNCSFFSFFLSNSFFSVDYAVIWRSFSVFLLLLKWKQQQQQNMNHYAIFEYKITRLDFKMHIVNEWKRFEALSSEQNIHYKSRIVKAISELPWTRISVPFQWKAKCTEQWQQ